MKTKKLQASYKYLLVIRTLLKIEVHRWLDNRGSTVVLYEIYSLCIWFINVDG